jgi:hypothetical protein
MARSILLRLRGSASIHRGKTASPNRHISLCHNFAPEGKILQVLDRFSETRTAQILSGRKKTLCDVRLAGSASLPSTGLSTGSVDDSPRRAAKTGHFSCSYNPAAERDVAARVRRRQMAF